MSAIKAYETETSIVVQYYDSGNAEKICCPKCHWSGRVPTMPFIQQGGTVEVSCMECVTKLALVLGSGLFAKSQQHL